MKRFIIMSLFLTISKMSAQHSDTEIVGKWKVVGFEADIKGLSKEALQEAEILKRSFLKSHFTFWSDRNFDFDFEDKDIQVKKGHWKYSTASKSYIIQEWKDKDKERAVLMEITVDKKNGKIYFLVSETPFMLEVQKEA